MKSIAASIAVALLGLAGGACAAAPAAVSPTSTASADRIHRILAGAVAPGSPLAHAGLLGVGPLEASGEAQ